MKKRLFFSVLALFFGIGVLSISLMNARPVSSQGQRLSSDHQLYFDKTILPDNVIYPFFMAVDRVQLEMASRNDRIFLEIEYANRRLGYGAQLLEMKKEDLAVTTFTKAENYLNDAVQHARDAQSADSVKASVMKALQYHMKKLKEYGEHLTDANRSVLDRTIEQDRVLLQSLN